MSRLSFNPDALPKPRATDTPEFRARLAEREQHRRADEAAGLIRDAGLPARAETADVDESGDWGTARDLARHAVGDGGIVALLGKRGTGKTVMAAALVRSWCHDTLRTAMYTTAAELFLHLLDGMESGTRVAAASRYASPGLLVIDEVHERGGSDYERRTLTGIIDRRYRDMKPTVLIANLTRAAFGELMGASVVSRMHECGTVIDCDWASFRGRGAM